MEKMERRAKIDKKEGKTEKEEIAKAEKRTK